MKWKRCLKELCSTTLKVPKKYENDYRAMLVDILIDGLSTN